MDHVFASAKDCATLYATERRLISAHDLVRDVLCPAFEGVPFSSIQRGWGGLTGKDAAAEWARMNFDALNSISFALMVLLDESYDDLSSICTVNMDELAQADLIAKVVEQRIERL